MVVDELEFLVHFNRTLCISLPAADVSLDAIKAHVQQREGVPADRLELFVNGHKLAHDAAIPCVPAIVRARMTDGLLGGKGGFGAMLRSMGKGSSGKATTSFGACRDLNGRRLRHVNQEIAMEKWKDESELREQRKKTGTTEREIMDEETPSGIPGWYLATPSWAEGIKNSYMKRRRNTTLCKNWLKARENGRTAPPKAPRWWGCPRGRDCDFAHGEDELRGEGLTEYKRQKKEEQYQKKQQELNQYVNYEQQIPNDIHDAIRQGMRNRNLKAKASAAAPESIVVPTASLPTESPVTPSIPEQWLAAVDGSVGTMFKHGLCELRGQANFGTATAPGCHITSGRWYYEVRLITDGVIQLGWADGTFAADSESGDGVGDHARSWAYDGARQLKWTSGSEQEYGEEWEQGDIIGCLFDADAGTLQFSRNGELMGFAFDNVKPIKHKDHVKRGFFPAISVEKTEILLVNVGAQPLLYQPAGYRAVAEAMVDVSKATTKQPVGANKTTAMNPTSEGVKTLLTTPPQNIEAKAATPTVPEIPVELLDLNKFKTVAALEKIGLEALKLQLQHRKLKCGGTLEERAKRLFSVRGQTWDEIDPKIKDFKAMRK